MMFGAGTIFVRKSARLATSNALLLHNGSLNLHVVRRADLPGTRGAIPSVAFDKRGIRL
jgi:hypothetical protein